MAQDVTPDTALGRFQVWSYWEGVDPVAEADSARWWVYLLCDGTEYREPRYVGMAHNLRRRLREHGRYWTSASAHVCAIAVPHEQAARRCEAALLSTIRPPGNQAFPSLTWTEEHYFRGLRERWLDGELTVCYRCGCLTEPSVWGPVPVTAPGPCCSATYFMSLLPDDDDEPIVLAE